ncbi:polysaccharide lyase family 7 protein [Winogradskyella vidalii]|uniref:polysaccharide lyase family 7 protein n=1 Tax=Winogradskyella vidalii TaxID=2615024 RepID=UPI0015C97936|nr:polysaccharide lyase family 7 protein [Winogradskyella vidalii]
MKNSLLIIFIFLTVVACKNTAKTTVNTSTDTTIKTQDSIVYPSDVIAEMDKWNILLGNGEHVKELVNYQDKDFFYTLNDGTTDWVVFKTPNSGVTSPNSGNTRTELRQKKEWTAEAGGKLSGTLKVQHVSTSGDARVAASYATVVGQIHGHVGHKNEPLKIFYKKYPGHTKGSVFWNYEINPEGDNSGRWDFSTAVWGYDFSHVGSAPDSYPAEPKDGIALGEEFSYEVKVENGIMHLTFISEGHKTKTFTKSLIASDFTNQSDIPEQIKTLYATLGRDGVERENAYADELQYFKLGAYNQVNGKNPEDNIVWSTGAETFNGDISKQYENGSYTEVWFKEISVEAHTIAF